MLNTANEKLAQVTQERWINPGICRQFDIGCRLPLSRAGGMAVLWMNGSPPISVGQLLWPVSHLSILVCRMTNVG
jgi:hypothetical protein